MITKQDVVKAILAWPGRYETRGGRQFLGTPVSEVPARLRDARWRNVSHLDSSDFQKLGLEVVEARYIGGVHPKKFCQVVVAGQVPCRAISSDWETFALQLMGVES